MTEKKTERRKLTLKKFLEILEDHKKYLEDNSLIHLKANFSNYEIDGTSFTKESLNADTNVCNGMRWNIENATILEGVNFSGALIKHLNIKQGIIRNSNFTDSEIIDTILNCEGCCQFNKVIIENASFGYDLTGSDFTNAALVNADFKGRNLTNCNFRNANLHGANLETNLFDGICLGGANLTGTKLPEEINKFEGVKNVEEASKNARTLFLGIIAASLYCLLTIGGTTDLALITNTTTSTLPIINAQLPLGRFYFVVPLLLSCLYLYFLLYFHRLSKLIAKLPAVFPDGTPIDEKIYPWLLNANIRHYFPQLPKEEGLIPILQGFLGRLLGWFLVPIVLIGFSVRFTNMQDFFQSFFLALCSASSWFFAFHFFLQERTLYNFIQQYKEGSLLASIFQHIADWLRRIISLQVANLPTVIIQRIKDPSERIYSWVAALMVLCMFGSISWLASYGDSKIQNDSALSVYLAEETISTRLEGCEARKDKDEKDDMDEFYFRCVKGAKLTDISLRYANLSRAFLVNANLSNSDLQGANLFHTYLQYAKLSNTNIAYARFIENGLSTESIKEARNWKQAIFPANIRKQLGISAKETRENIKHYVEGILLPVGVTPEQEVNRLYEEYGVALKTESK